MHADHNSAAADRTSMHREQQSEELTEQIAALRRMTQHYGELTERLAAAVLRERRDGGSEERALLGHVVAHFSPLYLTLLSIMQGVALAYFEAFGLKCTAPSPVRSTWTCTSARRRLRALRAYSHRHARPGLWLAPLGPL
jgi:hypothetical protein